MSDAWSGFDREGEATMTTSLDGALLDPSLDAVLLATPVNTYPDLASRTLAAGEAHLPREAARPNL
jgi:predicted dehydrogenase